LTEAVLTDGTSSLVHNEELAAAYHSTAKRNKLPLASRQIRTSSSDDTV
jgi:hypothetical protein